MRNPNSERTSNSLIRALDPSELVWESNPKIDTIDNALSVLKKHWMNGSSKMDESPALRKCCPGYLSHPLFFINIER